MENSFYAEMEHIYLAENNGKADQMGAKKM
jgi:hypothetical protein